MGELSGLDEVRAACGDDELMMWLAQRLPYGGVRAWSGGRALVVASPDISLHDRMGVYGEADEACALVEHALAECGTHYRLLGEATLVEQVVAKVPALRASVRFSWMSLRSPAAGGEQVQWLPREAWGEVAELLAVHAPESYAVPGGSGVLRWAGIRDERRRLVAVAAEAWSAPTVGVVAGVATDASSRGRGLAGRVCGWVASHLIEQYGRAALMVDDDNAAALRVYERLGFERRQIAAAWTTDG